MLIPVRNPVPRPTKTLPVSNVESLDTRLRNVYLLERLYQELIGLPPTNSPLPEPLNSGYPPTLTQLVLTFYLIQNC